MLSSFLIIESESKIYYRFFFYLVFHFQCLLAENSSDFNFSLLYSERQLLANSPIDRLSANETIINLKFNSFISTILRLCVTEWDPDLHIPDPLICCSSLRGIYDIQDIQGYQWYQWYNTHWERSQTSHRTVTDQWFVYSYVPSVFDSNTFFYSLIALTHETTVRTNTCIECCIHLSKANTFSVCQLFLSDSRLITCPEAITLYAIIFRNKNRRISPMANPMASALTGFGSGADSDCALA